MQCPYPTTLWLWGLFRKSGEPLQHGPSWWLSLALPGGTGTSGLSRPSQPSWHSCPRGSQRGSQRRGRAGPGAVRDTACPAWPLPGVSPRILLAVLAWEAGDTTACHGCGAERRSSAGLCPPCRSRCPGHALSSVPSHGAAERLQPPGLVRAGAGPGAAALGQEETRLGPTQVPHRPDGQDGHCHRSQQR